LEPITVGALLDVVRSKVVTTVERAGFTLTIDIDPTVHSVRVRMDQDAFVQVCINLVDNALKFSSDASRREIVLSAGTLQDSVLFCVRDFGPGIAPGDMKRLFELFYRPDNERTRATAGTGIGLALVKQLVTAMDGRVDVRNCDPGAEFRLSFSRTA
jgi:signal transduction histidine kinase